MGVSSVTLAEKVAHLAPGAWNSQEPLDESIVVTAIPAGSVGSASDTSPRSNVDTRAPSLLSIGVSSAMVGNHRWVKGQMFKYLEYSWTVAF